jgi:hypothetical protein
LASIPIARSISLDDSIAVTRTSRPAKEADQHSEAESYEAKLGQDLSLDRQ